MTAPVVKTMRVVPVAGRDGMLLNLSGAHAPFFTRNLVILTDSDGLVGVGEVPGGWTRTRPGVASYVDPGLVTQPSFSITGSAAPVTAP